MSEPDKATYTRADIDAAVAAERDRIFGYLKERADEALTSMLGVSADRLPESRARYVELSSILKKLRG